MTDIKNENSNIGVPNVYLSDLEKIIKKVKEVTEEENAEVSFEFIIASLFPTCWYNIQEELKRQFTLGYIQGQKEGQQIETGSFICEDDDPECYCE